MSFRLAHILAVLVGLAPWGGGVCAFDGESTATASRPSIILIVSDDQGYADLGVQGAKDLSTPNIDSLARNGVRFTNGYVSAPVCSPSRAGMLTGRYQTRFGHETNPAPVDDETFGLPLEQKTIADYLKRAGYATGLVGKWHLGARPEFRPQRRGFDEFFGFLGGAHMYFQYQMQADSNAMRRGDTPVRETDYLTDAFTREALSFIDRHTTEPFFLYLAYNAIHTPMQVPNARLKKFIGIKDITRRAMAAMLESMDAGIGRILQKLREKGIAENTIVVFISDNGGPTGANASSNHPFSGMKGQTLEGGIRVPFIMQWPARLPKGKVYDKPVISLDILPTLMAAAGTTVSADADLDGVNLLPYLTGENADAPHARSFWKFGPEYAVREGDWKLVRSQNLPPKLIRLEEDPGEQVDLSAKFPAKARELQAAHDEWNRGNVTQSWKGSVYVPRDPATSTTNSERTPGRKRGAKPSARANQRDVGAGLNIIK